MKLNSPWSNKEDSRAFFNNKHPSQENSLHPKVIRHIEQLDGSLLLDFGCGDGRILHRVPENWVIEAYDPNKEILKICRSSLGDRVANFFSKVEDISKKYDVILLGMVLLCLEDEQQVLDVFRHCHRLLNPGGSLLITTTHPCFRFDHFSNVKFKMFNVDKFNYLRNGEKFDVTISDLEENDVTFTDYHWTLDFTSRALFETGLLISRLIEIADDPNSGTRNQNYPPYLLIECIIK